MALGLRRAGFRSLWCGDLDPRAVATAQAAGFPAEVLRLDALSAAALAGRLQEDVDLVAGGPPCQGLSVAGKGLGKYDPRDGFPAMLALVRETRPKAVLIENVKGLTSGRHRPYLGEIVADMEALGYVVPRCPDRDWPGRVHDAADFGTLAPCPFHVASAYPTEDAACATLFSWSSIIPAYAVDPATTASGAALLRDVWIAAVHWDRAIRPAIVGGATAVERQKRLVAWLDAEGPTTAPGRADDTWTNVATSVFASTAGIGANIGSWLRRSWAVLSRQGRLSTTSTEIQATTIRQILQSIRTTVSIAEPTVSATPRVQAGCGLCRDWATPQRRRRILIVAFRDVEAARRFRWPEPTHHQGGLVWAKWGTAGEARGGIAGGSYWAEHGMAGPDGSLGLRTGEAGALGRCVDSPGPVVPAQGNQYLGPAGGTSAARPRHGIVRPPAGPATRPSREEARILREILAGRLEVRGPRWRTVRDALGGTLLTTERGDRAVSIDSPHPTIAGHRPGGGGASTLLLTPPAGQARLPQSMRAENPDRPSSTVQGGGGESHHAPAVLGIVGDAGASRVASRPIGGLDEPSLTVRGGSVLKGGAGGGVMWALTPDHPGAERAVDMVAGRPTALRRPAETPGPVLRPFFSFYGGKWRAAPRYPAPAHDTVIEPFAGAAGYSVRHAGRRVVLVERDPAVAGTWRWLLRASPGEILALPDMTADMTVDDLDVCEEARWLIGWWCNAGAATPHRRLSAWARSMPAHGGAGWTTGGGQLTWGRKVRERLAAQVEAIRHWTLIEGSYEEAPDVEATWFVDPPYIKAGRHYRLGPDTIDYAALASWCRERQGQVMVCENEGADWLPFRPFAHIKASPARHGGKVSREAIWTQDAQRATALVRNTALHRAPEIVDHADMLGVACRRGRTARDGTDRPDAVWEARSADEPSVALRGSEGGSSRPFLVIGAGTNPHGPGRPEERTRREITDEPGMAMTAAQIGNRGPWVAQEIRYPTDGSHGTAGTEPGRLDEPSVTVTVTEGKGTRAHPGAGWDFHGGPDRAADGMYRAIGLRRLTPGECALLQGFPADWPWQGPRTAIYRGVGNACPPPLAEAIGQSLAAVLSEPCRTEPPPRRPWQSTLFGLA